MYFGAGSCGGASGALSLRTMNWTGIATTAVGVYGLLLVVMFLFQRNLMYYPPRDAPEIAPYAASGLAEIQVEGRGRGGC